ncbi:MAG: glycosyltransferase [Acidimicrobiia bacterium]|nr:glycosyltransferase [Acidimicrobiia bacterium]
MISVVVPAYNEAALLGQTVRELVDGLRALGDPFELHIVENGSTDGTPTVLRQIAEAVPEVQAHSMRVANYGEALRTGLLASQGDVAVIFDADFWDLQFMKEALSVLDAAPEPAGPVIVVGSKRAPGSQDDRAMVRRLATNVFSTILRAGFGLTVSDTHGMKVLNLGVVRPIVRSCRNGSDLFDTELILRAERAGLSVAEVPVSVAELRPARTSIARRVPRTLLGLAKLRVHLGSAR